MAMQKQGSRIVFCLGLVAVLSLISCDPSKDTQQAAVDDLLNAFAGGCSAGAWTQAALARSAALTGAYTALLSKASCQNNKNLQDALNGAQDLQSQLNQALNQESDYRDERVSEEAVNDLLLALKENPSMEPIARDQLLSYYAQSRYQLSYSRARESYINHFSFKSQGVQGLSRFSHYAQTILANTQNLAQCIADNPAKKLEIAANLGSIAGAFAPSMVGLAVSSLSKMVSVAVEAATAFPSAEAIYQSRQDRMQDALICGLEALTRDYCKARDADYLNNLTRSQKEPLPFFYGIEMADRDLPKLYAALDEVVGGATTSSLDQAGKVNTEFSRLNRMLQISRNAQGVLGDMDNNLKNPSLGSDARIRIVNETLSDLILHALYSERDPGFPYTFPDGPFRSDDPYRVVGHLAGFNKPSLQSPGESIPAYVSRLGLEYNDALPGQIRQRVGNLLETREQEVVSQFIQKVNINPTTVVRNATSEDTRGRSAVSALHRLFHFFDHYAFAPGSLGGQDVNLIGEIRPDLEAVFNELIDPDATTKAKATEIINDIFKKFKLENTNVFLPAQLQLLVRNDLTTRFRKGEGPHEIDDILLLAGRDIDRTLERSKLGQADVDADLARAQSTTQDSLKGFRNFYKGTIAQVMKDLKKSADENREPPVTPGSRSPKRRTLGQLCILTLVSGMDWPADADKSTCAGTKMISKDAKLELSFDDLNAKMDTLSLDDRLCLNESFHRLDRLAGQGLKRPGEDSFVPAPILRSSEAASLSSVTEQDALNLEDQRKFWQRVLDDRVKSRR